MFLISILSALPPTGKTSADPAIEALNAIFDVYADADFDYDEEVFVKHKFLDHLIAIVPKVKAMVGSPSVSLSCAVDYKYSLPINGIFAYPYTYYEVFSI